MSFSPKKFREIVFQILFSYEMGDPNDEEFVPFMMKELATTKRIIEEARSRARAVFVDREALDLKIAAISDSYSFSRIGRVERIVLRLAFFELEENVLPKAIVIGEAIRLACKFSAPEAGSFVNALLDSSIKPIDTNAEISDAPLSS